MRKAGLIVILFCLIQILGFNLFAQQSEIIVDSTKSIVNNTNLTISQDDLAQFNNVDFQLIEIMFGVIIALLLLLIYSFFLLKFKLGKVLKRETEKRKFIEIQMKELMIEYEDHVKESSEDIKSSEKKLKKSENRYKQLVQHIQEGMVIVDSDDNFIFANPAALEIFGTTRSQIIGKNFKEFIRHEDLQDLAIQNRLRLNGKSSRYETIIVRSNGTERIIKISGSPLIEDGILVGSIAVFMDKTDQKKTENLHSVLYNISNAVNTSSTLDQLFRKIHKDLSIIIDTTNIYIALYDKETNIISAPYYIDTTNNKIPEPQQLGDGLTAFVLKSGKPLFLTQDKREKMVKAGQIPSQAWRSKIWMGVPLKLNNEAIGVIALQSYTNPNLYTKNDLGILEFVSEQIAIVVSNKRAEKALQTSEKFNRTIINNSPIGITARDRKGRLIIANSAWLKLWGKTAEDIVEDRKARDSIEFDKRDLYLDKYIDKVKNIYLNGGELFIPELRIHVKGDPEDCKWISHYFYAIRNELGEVDRVIILTSDITEGKKVQSKLEISLKEKELLLKEVHHRVKNNMQIISSMLKLQSSYIKDPKALELFVDSQNRVKSMALIHEKLYQSDNFENVDFYQYVRVLTNNLIRSMSVNPDYINLIIEIDNVLLTINKAIPCGLIINELISNVFKHAFTGDKNGMVRVVMKQEDKDYLLQVIDDGIGFPDEIDFKKTDSLGLQLVSALNTQLHGNISMRVDNGTMFEIKFPLE